MNARIVFAVAVFEMFAVFSCKSLNVRGDKSQVSEAFDNTDFPESNGLNILSFDQIADPNSRNGFRSETQWTDDFWPDQSKGIAKRYADVPRVFKSVADQIKDARANRDYLGLSPAEKYDLATDVASSFPLTSASWDKYNALTSRFAPGTWGWMGICDGVANASMREPSPQRAVRIVDGEGRRIVFYPGDIRALMSKVYAENILNVAPKVFGGFCPYSAKDVVKDRFGRPVDGFLTDDKDLKPFWIEDDQWTSNGYIRVVVGEERKQTIWLASQDWKWSRSQNDIRDGERKVYVYDSLINIESDYYSSNYGANSKWRTTVRFYRSCRDLNPGVFHMLLVDQYTGDTRSKSGIAIDFYQGVPVFNYPVAGFSTKVGPLYKSSDLKEGLPNFYLAKGSKYLANIETQVFYIANVGPKKNYQNPVRSLELSKIDVKESGLKSATWKYRLEFNADKKIIGGEWDYSSDSTPPDVAWIPGAEPTDKVGTLSYSNIYYSTVKKLLNCSTDTKRKVVSQIDGELPNAKIEVVDCEL